jgi:PST family polysaccharide transporter
LAPLFLWQLIGDFFKIAAWILSYLMLAKAMVKTFIVTEIVFNSINIILSFYFIEIFYFFFCWVKGLWIKIRENQTKKREDK